MEHFSFEQQSEKIYAICEEILHSFENHKNEEVKTAIENYKDFLIEHRKKTKLSIAFIGQYNAGKSTTIAALANARFKYREYREFDGEQKLVEIYNINNQNLYVGAQVLTNQVQEYSWRDVHIIDTPGIYSGRDEHDQRTFDQISKSDLLVYVISNELFNPQGGSFFRKLVNEMQRVNQMLLVVNKMSREHGTPEVLKSSILEVIEPYHPDDFHTTFIDAKDYIKAQLEDDEEEKRYLLEDSNMENFQLALIKLIEKNKLNARLITPLHRGKELLESILNMICTDDQLSLDVLEILRRKALLIKTAEIRFKNAVRNDLSKVEHQVIMEGEKIAGKIDGNHKEEELDKVVKEVEKNIENFTKITLDKIQTHLSAELKRLEEELENLQNSELVSKVIGDLQAQMVEKKKLSSSSSVEKSKIPSILIKGPEVLGKIGSFATTVTKDQVYNLVKFFGGKFKPWGATKLTKHINKLGPALSIVGTVLDVFFSAKEEIDEAKFEKSLREARAKVREEFRNISEEIVEEYNQIINKQILPFFTEELESITKQQSEIRNIEKKKEEDVYQVENLLKAVNKELTSIN